MGILYNCSLLECLEKYFNLFTSRYTQSEALGTNQYQCYRCGQNQEATKQLSIKKSPPVLSFQIKVRISLFHPISDMIIMTLQVRPSWILKFFYHLKWTLVSLHWRGLESKIRQSLKF
jgi:ubiquitin C-terminal hydrolase